MTSSESARVRVTTTPISRYDADIYAVLTDGDVSVIHATSHAAPGEYAVAELHAPTDYEGLPARVERIHGLTYHNPQTGTGIRAWAREHARGNVESVGVARAAFRIPDAEPEVTR